MTQQEAKAVTEAIGAAIEDYHSRVEKRRAEEARGVRHAGGIPMLGSKAAAAALGKLRSIIK